MYNFNYTKEEIEDVLMEIRKNDVIELTNSQAQKFINDMENVKSIQDMVSFPFCNDAFLGFIAGFCCAQKLAAREKITQ